MEGSGMSFSSEFWNKEPGIFCGYTILTEKMKVGSSVLDRYIEFSKQIVYAVESFRKALSKAAKGNPMDNETGYLLQTGCILTNGMKQLIEDCMNAAAAIKMEIKSTTLVAQDLNAVRKSLNNTMNEHKNNVTEDIKRLKNAERLAKARLQEFLQFDESPQLQATDQSNSTDTEQDVAARKEKFHRLRAKSEIAFDEAEHQYKAAVSELNEKIDGYKKEAEEQFQTMEKHETMRQYHLKETIWLTCNILSQLATEIDKQMELIRRSLKEFNIEEDVQLWIAKNRTGQISPEHVAYFTIQELLSQDDASKSLPSKSLNICGMQ